MNQSIQFPEQRLWLAKSKQVEFPAMRMGELLCCRITIAALANIAGGELQAEESKALAAFDEYRFDIEELAEELIDEDAFDEEGVLLIE